MQQNSWDVLPKQFLERLKLIIPEEKIEEVLSSFTVKKPTTFRANTLKITSIDLKKKLEEQNIEVEQIDFLPDAFILKNQPQKVLTETEEYKNGMLYIQSLSSMIPPLIVNPQLDEKILDITAAPGSKTTQMAMLMENTGEILANDKSRVRLYKLEANLKSQSVTNTKISYAVGQMLWQKYPEYFDKALVDVPCSMEGRFLTTYEKSYRDWSISKIKYLQQQQKFLLRSAISATKVDGIIVYSTCTLEPEENEEVIDWILKKEKDRVEVEAIEHTFPNMQNGITQFNASVFDSTISKTLRILPSTLMEGFYIAKLRKLNSNI